MAKALAGTRRVKENRFFNNRIEIEPPAPPALPGAKKEATIDLESVDEIQLFMKEEGPVADGVRRVVMAVKAKRRSLETEWDVRAAVAKFVRDYKEAVPKADPEYLRGMNLALNVYLGSKEAQ